MYSGSLEGYNKFEGAYSCNSSGSLSYVGQIVGYSSIDVNLNSIDNSVSLFECYASNTTANWMIYHREIGSQSGEVELVPQRIYVLLDNITEDGTLTVTEYVNRRASTARTESIEANTSVPIAPFSPPFGQATEDTVRDVPFILETKVYGVQYILVFP